MTAATIPRPIVATATVTRAGDLYRVNATDADGDPLVEMSGEHDSLKAAMGFAGGLRMTFGCKVINKSCPEID